MSSGQPGEDVIASGRQTPGRPGRLVRLLLITETAVLAGSVAVALHYRSEAGRPDHGEPSAHGAPAAPPWSETTSVAFRLPGAGAVAGTVVITTAAGQPGAARAQFAVSAFVTGGKPGTVYHLTGNDCSDTGAVADRVWATGHAGPDGTAELAGHGWTGTVTDQYWLALSPSAVSPPPGLHGRFAAGAAVPFPAGQAPCVPVP
jgi:hypothetical protein